MKRSEIITEISHYKADINRMLQNKGSDKAIGYTLTNGKSPAIYLVEQDQRVSELIVRTDTGKELLTAIQAIHKTVKFAL